MILSRHPDLMSDDELRDWLIGLVSQQTPESIFLDYKETIATDSRSDKQEIAKDISSFANERGGIVLYGVPQVEGGDEPVPVGVDDIGMNRIAGLPEVIENVLVGALTPRLPELRIREILLAHLPGDKVVYMVWHPESWEAPHMIHAYEEHRYYRRGNYRAVLMEEAEVERLYTRRQSRRSLADQFLETAEFGELRIVQNEQEKLMRIVVCPAFPFEDRVNFTEEVMRNWLRDNIPEGGPGWLPFVDGVRFASCLKGGRRTSLRYLTETHLFRNGASSICSSSITAYNGEAKILGTRFLRNLDLFLRLVGRFYEQIGMVGDVFVDVRLFNVEGIKFQPGANVSLGSYYDLQYYRDTLHFRVSASAIEMLTDNGRWALERRIMYRLVQCFGLWAIPRYFGENGAPII
jgi:hypothetical protein